MKVDRYNLGEVIRKAYLKHGNDSWCSIADDVIVEFFKKDEMSVSDISLAIAIVMHCYDNKEIPPIKSVKTAVEFIKNRTKELAVNNLVIPGMVEGKMEQFNFPIEVYAKAQWIENALKIQAESV